MEDNSIVMAFDMLWNVIQKFYIIDKFFLKLILLCKIDFIMKISLYIKKH